MKFCKNLQRVVDISDPEWAPYWPNYKMLKKLIKELPSLVPADDNKGNKENSGAQESESNLHSRPESPSTESAASTSSHAAAVQQHGDMTAEKTKKQTAQRQAPRAANGQAAAHIGKSPGEVAFFKLLHSELRKAAHFFDRATEEFKIREERVKEGMEIMRKPNSIMVTEKWTLMGKSIYRLYKDLLLLETFAIMAYCSFSKILKKHDKVTGYETRIAFMMNIVNKANFTHYPDVLAMINRCESLYEEVSRNLLKEGKEGLYEDERLFINMIHRLNEQVLGSEDGGVGAARKEAPRRIVAKVSSNEKPVSHAKQVSHATSTIRTIVEENESKRAAAHVQQGCVDSECVDTANKRSAQAEPLSGTAKRQKAI